MRHGPAIMILAALSLGFSSMAYGIDPPEKMWDASYEWIRRFNDIRLYSDSLLVAAITPNVQAECMYMLNLEGNIIWQQGLEDPVSMNAVCQGPSDTFVFAGCSGWVLDDPWDTALLLVKTDIDGEIEWQRIYDVSEQWEEGYDVAALPDGGYAVCGRVYGEGLNLGQAWILRTDANGDTLWTDVWGTHTVNYAIGVEYDSENDWLAVLAYGRSDSLQVTSPHMLYYTLDGEYLLGTSYPELPGENPKDLCRFSDGDYGFVSRYGGTPATVSRTDYLGELIWSETIGVGFGYGDPYGMDRTVLDDGCMVTGQAVEGPDRGNLAEWARFIRYDGEGNEMWNIAEADDTDFRAALQLPQGGYMAVGSKYGDGYLVRYAPETGIEGPVSPGGSGLLRPVTPNPSSSMFHVSLDLPEAMDVRLEVYDTAGRRVGLLADGLLGAGEQSFSWDASGLSSGCYLARLSGAGVCETRRCVLLR